MTSAIGEGTFSTVYLGKPKNSAGGEASASKADGEVALKHLIPTSSPERVLMEVDCLRIAQGRHNVMPLLFCHRVGGDVILGMPVIRPAKFGELIRVVAMKEMLTYMKRLLEALAHIHKLKILHRDIKPANFLYNRQHQQFGLVDFGLAQQMGQATPEKKEQFTSRKR